MDNKAKTILQKEIVDSIPDKPHGRLALAPRLGKTKIIIDLIKREKPKSILWVTIAKDLAEVEIPSEMDKWKAKKFIPKLTITTWKSLEKKEGHFEMIIFDEEQHLTENNIKNLLNNSLTFDYIISMTGTRTKTKDKISLYNILELYETFYNYSIEDAVEDGILADYTINLLGVPLSIENNIKCGNKNKPFYSSEEKMYKSLSKRVENASGKSKIFAALFRKNFIKNCNSKIKATETLLKTLDKNNRVLIFGSSVKVIDSLTEHTYHSKAKDTSKLRKFQTGEINQLGLVNSGGTGTTYKNIDNLIIMQVDSDENGLTTQKIARTLLEQGKDYKANVWIVYLQETQDIYWVKQVLKNFDPEKIKTHFLDRKFNFIQN